ncbi:hypothetical protein UA08_04921 [Talaromyces atroroseus]|uniref:Uncharacterized protein n=1 Tax=Talaromyces atroroseus TaxID=1441469 RepID=A0A225B2V3_TALAT|nr:hypothetical protein UA08_04921 [Talaromyces atroroseus]OKL60187.1 hypothetical protein UA08_04921 [Talaromyces atroroseus]
MSLRLFGSFILDDPKDHLTEDRQLELKRLLPLIEKLEEESSQGHFDHSSWDMNDAFEHFRDEETAWWKSRNVDRPRNFIVRPSGRLDSRVACHLFNPTFAVCDPTSETTFDLSNPTMIQLKDAGISLEKCLVFDHLARRDDSKHSVKVYPPDLWEINEGFVFALRHEMAAVVELCWGANVKSRMHHCFPDLQPLPLWGRYEGVTLYLEHQKDQTGNCKSIRRFIIFVRPPQYFMYVFADTPGARRFRRYFGKEQDLHLEVAALLGNIAVSENFYESSPRLIQNLRIPKVVRLARDKLKGEARVQLETAFPGLDLAPVKVSFEVSPEVEANWAIEVERLKADTASKPAVLAEGNIEDDHTRRENHRRKAALFHINLQKLVNFFLPDMPFKILKPDQYENLIQSIEELDWEFNSWEELPEVITTLFHTEKGLKIDQHTITSREELETAFQLTYCKGNVDNLSIMGLAFSVLLGYNTSIRQMNHLKRSSVSDLLVSGGPGRDVVPRKCSICRRRVLDDPVAYYAKNNSKTYALKYRKNGCGRTGCTKKAEFYPIDGNLRRIRIEKKLLEAIPNPEAEWEPYLLRNKNELDVVPRMVVWKCPTEGCPGTLEDNAPRWTFEKTSRLLNRKLMCPVCCTQEWWEPVKTSIQTVRGSSISRMWASLKKAGCDPRQYPRRPDICFANARIPTRIAMLKEAKRLQEEKHAMNYP